MVRPPRLHSGRPSLSAQFDGLGLCRPARAGSPLPGDQKHVRSALVATAQSVRVVDVPPLPPFMAHHGPWSAKDGASGLPAVGLRRHRLSASRNGSPTPTCFASARSIIHRGWNARLRPGLLHIFPSGLLHPHLLEVADELAQSPLRRTMSPSDPRSGAKTLSHQPGTTVKRR